MTRRHLSLFTPTYMYVVAVPGGSGNFLLLLPRPGGICTLSPHARGLSAGAPISLPTTKTILVTSRQQPFHHETDLRSGSGHQVPQKGGSYPPPQRGGQIPASAITRRETAEPLSGMFHAATRMCRIPATARGAQRCNNKQPFFSRYLSPESHYIH